MASFCPSRWGVLLLFLSLLSGHQVNTRSLALFWKSWWQIKVRNRINRSINNFIYVSSLLAVHKWTTTWWHSNRRWRLIKTFKHAFIIVLTWFRCQYSFDFLPCLILIYDKTLLSSQPLLSGHLSFPRGWPLNRGSTVTGQTIIFIYLFSIVNVISQCAVWRLF